MQTVPIRIFPSFAVLPAFAGTLFLSAGLMFMVEPMVARMVLPRLGGSPAVWSTCLMFFQAILLLGYAYAHGLARTLSRPIQILVHVGVVLPLAALVLPLDLGAGAPAPAESPSLWLLLRLVLAAGPPVFAISATAPLLQGWFAGADHAAAGDPYFLYAGSNAGSLLGLLAYPLLAEPTLPLVEQASLWSWGFGILALGIALCAAATWGAGDAGPRTRPRESTLPGSLRERVLWTALAFVPSSLLLGVTMHLTTDVAAAPLFWVVPLALYLLTFILVFARRPPLSHSLMQRVLPYSLILVVLAAAPGAPFTQSLPVMLVLHLGCFFAIAMVCHGELARLRPHAARLTEFYFFLAVGGVLGGVFNALLAPAIFPDVWEYPLVLVAACLMRPAASGGARHAWVWDALLPVGLLGVLLLARHLPADAGEGARLSPLQAILGYLIPALALLNFSPRRWRFAIGIAICVVVPPFAGQGDTLATQRSFFGVYRIRVVETDGARFLTLMDGTTLHGVKSLSPGEETMPMGYYSREGPFGRFFAAAQPDTTRRVAVIGLGTGELICHAHPGQDWTFYEIDPLVEQIARDPRYFNFLDNCGNRPRVVLGDARLTIAAAPDGAYDILIIDAFSSDSIPVHLLTREALEIYLRKLAPGGQMLFHISSRSLDLRPVLAALATDAGLPARLLFDWTPPGTPTWRRSSALVVAVAARGGNLDNLDPAHGWANLPPAGSRWLWTDQRSDLLRVIRLGL